MRIFVYIKDYDSGLVVNIPSIYKYTYIDSVYTLFTHVKYNKQSHVFIRIYSPCMNHSKNT